MVGGPLAPGRSCGSVWVDRRVWVELERHSRDLEGISWRKALLLERAQHADPTKTRLHIRHRILVVNVVAGQQSLDAAPGDPEGALAESLDKEAAGRCRTKHHVLSQLRLTILAALFRA